MPRKADNDFLKKPKYVQAAIVAQLHYAGKTPMNQGAIANKFSLTGSQVSRLLTFARDNMLVETRLRLDPDTELVVKLIHQYGLVDAHVVPIWHGRDSDSKEDFREQLAYAAARYLEEPNSLFRSGSNVGIACGATIRDLLMAMTPRRFDNLKISQLTIQTECDRYLDTSPLFLVGMLLAKSRGTGKKDSKAHGLHPLQESLSKADGDYDKERAILEMMAEDLDIALVGIGDAKAGAENGSFGHTIEACGLSSRLKKLGVVGEICNRPLNVFGEDLFDAIPDLKKHFDGVSLDILKKLALTKKVIAIAGGPSKYAAIRVALSSRICNFLITDRETALDLCKDE